MSSCVSLTGFEEGRTLGEGNSEMIISGSLTRVPDLLEDEVLDTIENLSFPSIEFSYKRGVSEKLDVGAKVSTNLNVSAFAKYQVVGDRSSSFALAPGLEIGSVSGIVYNIGVPVYLSYYPAEAIAINLTPRYVYQTVTGNAETGNSYLGGNFGLLFGKKNKFGLDIGYYNVSGGLGGGDGQKLLSFGIGGKFKFGDFETASNGRRSGR